MAWQVFYSYSHKDTELRNQIGTFLAPLRHNNKIVEWHDRKIEPGANWQNEISVRLDSAHLILLLISADFLASDYCFGVEVEKAMRRLKRGEVEDCHQFCLSRACGGSRRLANYRLFLAMRSRLLLGDLLMKLSMR